MGTKKDKKSIGLLPFVSICTPTFNRRPFIPGAIMCFNNQDYPASRMEWIIIDDGTDPIEDLVIGHPCVKYFRYNEKMTLGKKRNLMHEKCSGDIIIYMDDDDYYPPQRVSHAVNVLTKHKDKMIAGSSEMYIYFKENEMMVKFGPYSPNHATAATFAFRKEFLKNHKYDETACLAEEKKFLNDYTEPMVQLDPMKVILVFSHEHNSFDKRKLLDNLGTKNVNESSKKVRDFIKEREVEEFYMNIGEKIKSYEMGKPEYKPDVRMQMEKMEEERRNKVTNLNSDYVQKIIDNENKKYNNLKELYEKKIRENMELKSEIESQKETISAHITNVDIQGSIIDEQAKRIADLERKCKVLEEIHKDTIFVSK